MQTNEQKQAPKKPDTTGKKVSKLAGVNLEIARGNSLVVRIPGRPDSFRGTTIGYEPYEYIIANVRIPQAVRTSLGYQDAIIIKYLHEGTVYGFRSTLLNHITRPAPLIFLTYPDSIEKLELRQTSRCSCNLDGMLYTMEGKGHDCLVLNMSETGCMVATCAKARDPLNALAVGEDMLVEIHLGSIGTIKIPVVIKNIGKERGTIRFGTMFLDITEKEKELIGKYVERIEKLST